MMQEDKMTLQHAVNEFCTVRNPMPQWRVISMLTEEAGEVQGAFNKWKDGNRRKPKTQADVIEELVQLTGCCFIAAAQYGFSVEDLLWEASCFVREKSAQIIADEWSPEDQVDP